MAAQVITLGGDTGHAEVLPLASHTKAESYHQQDHAKHPSAGYCAFVVAPKGEEFKRTFRARVRAA